MDITTGAHHSCANQPNSFKPASIWGARAHVPARGAGWGGRSSQPTSEGMRCVSAPAASPCGWTNSPNICFILLSNVPQWGGVLGPQSRNLFRWLSSLSFPVSLPHAPVSVFRAPFKMSSVHANSCLRSSAKKPSLRPDAVGSDESVDSGVPLPPPIFESYLKGQR